MRMPILFFAVAMANGVMDYEASGSASIPVPEGDNIRLSAGRAPGRVAVRGETRESVEVDLASLREAVQAFHAKAARVMVEHLPRLSAVPELGDWYRR